MANGSHESFNYAILQMSHHLQLEENNSHSSTFPHQNFLVIKNTQHIQWKSLAVLNIMWYTVL